MCTYRENNTICASTLVMEESKIRSCYWIITRGQAESRYGKGYHYGVQNDQNQHWLIYSKIETYSSVIQ